MNNLSPLLLSVFTDYLHSYGLVRLPFHAFCSRYPETEIPCSTIEPNFKSCRLYNGGHIASKQVSAMLVSLHPSHNAILPDYLCDFVTSSAIHLHSSLKVIPDGFFFPPFLYPFTTSALQLLQRRAVWQPHLYGIADTSQWLALPLLYHLYCSMLKNFGIP